jgi:membrane-associated phospholipid phosphatase
LVSKSLKVILIGLVLAGVFALTLDQPISLWFSHPDHDAYEKFALTITDIGLAEHWFALAVLTFLSCKLFLKFKPNLANATSAKLQNFQNWGAHFFFALCTSGFILQTLKHLVGRQRPHISLSRDPLIFHPLSNHWDWHSFPSGHTQTLFCVATIFSTLWPKHKISIFLLAFLFSLTRVMAVQHFFSDIIGGALVGILGAQISLHFFARWVPAPKNNP